MKKGGKRTGGHGLAGGAATTALPLPFCKTSMGSETVRLTGLAAAGADEGIWSREGLGVFRRANRASRCAIALDCGGPGCVAGCWSAGGEVGESKVA